MAITAATIPFDIGVGRPGALVTVATIEVPLTAKRRDPHAVELRLDPERLDAAIAEGLRAIADRLTAGDRGHHPPPR